MPKSPQLAILDDHPVFRSGLKLTFSPQYHVEIEAGSAAEFYSKLDGKKIDILVLDLYLPDMSGIEVAKQLRQTHPDIKILVLTIDSREEIIEKLIELGVDGFLCKNSTEDVITEAMECILAGEKYYTRPVECLERNVLLSKRSNHYDTLSKREQDVMLALCKGMNSTEIAKKMCISSRTVDNHKQHIFAKLGIHNIVQLVTYAVRNKIILLE